jgi:hypothetical protein
MSLVVTSNIVLWAIGLEQRSIRVTVTDVVVCPTVSWRSTVAVSPTETVIPLRISVLKPGATTVTLYSPAANSGTV